MYQTPTLSDWPYRIVRLACDHCPRRGQYRKETLLARFGGDVLMPDVRHKIAHCPRFTLPTVRWLRAKLAEFILPTFGRAASDSFVAASPLSTVALLLLLYGNATIAAVSVILRRDDA